MSFPGDPFLARIGFINDGCPITPSIYSPPYAGSLTVILLKIFTKINTPKIIVTAKATENIILSVFGKKL